MSACIAYNCKKRDGKAVRAAGITFHRFPREPQRLEQWIINMKWDYYEPNEKSRMCSSHFTSYCFDKTGQTVRLKADAIPTIFDYPDHLKKSFHNSVIEGNNCSSRINSDDESEATEINPADLLTTVIDEGEGGDAAIDGLDLDEEHQEPDNVTSPGESKLNNLVAELLLDKAGVYHCEDCGNAFKYTYLLSSHTRQVHQGSEEPFQCPTCGSEHPSIYDLKCHLLTHIGGVKLHSCQVCGQGFPETTSLKLHILTHSSGPERFPRCELCGTEFPSKNELIQHIVKYQGKCNSNKIESFHCVTCNVELANSEELKEHRQTQHPSNKGFRCNNCGKKFNCRTKLRDHLVVHTGEKPYPCDICGKSFSFIDNMKKHRETHNEGRTELCPYCEKAYKTKLSLYYHIKKGYCRGLPNTQAPDGYHRCSECLQIFTIEECYRAHKEKNQCGQTTPNSCNRCGMKCSSPIKLKKHLAKGCESWPPKPKILCLAAEMEQAAWPASPDPGATQTQTVHHTVARATTVQDTACPQPAHL